MPSEKSRQRFFRHPCRLIPKVIMISIHGMLPGIFLLHPFQRVLHHKAVRKIILKADNLFSQLISVRVLRHLQHLVQRLLNVRPGGLHRKAVRASKRAPAATLPSKIIKTFRILFLINLSPACSVPIQTANHNHNSCKNPKPLCSTPHSFHRSIDSFLHASI